jgi:hypothetical protein
MEEGREMGMGMEKEMEKRFLFLVFLYRDIFGLFQSTFAIFREFS